MGSFTRAALHCAFAADTCLRAILFPTPRLPECRNIQTLSFSSRHSSMKWFPPSRLPSCCLQWGAVAEAYPVALVHAPTASGDSRGLGRWRSARSVFRRRLLGVRRVCCPTCLGRRRWPYACRGIGRCRGVRRRRPCCWRFLLLRVRGSGVVFRGLLGC